MFGKFIKFIFKKSSYKTSSLIDNKRYTEPLQIRIQQNIEANQAHLKSTLGKSDDVIFREFELNTKKTVKVLICFINGIVNLDFINKNIIKSVMEPLELADLNGSQFSSRMIKVFKNHILSAAELKEADCMDKVIDAILSGETALFIDGCDSALTISTQGFESRSIEEPKTESVVRGPREGFTEVLQVNTSLIRRKIKNPQLIFENLVLGKQTRTTICVGYLDGIANPQIIQEVKQRLNRIDTDAILESGYIEEFIKDHPYSPFATVGNSEKPDIVVAKLLEGRVAILCDGTPFVLTVPHLFVENLQNSEDYYSLPFLSSGIRLLRFAAFSISIFTPAFYVAISSFHQEMIPTVMLITMAASLEGTPFPAAYEAVLMGIVFELLREAGVRMPRPVGQAISIVGALVIGEAAVNAGVVSAPMVIVIAITAISSFIVTTLYNVIVLFRFFILILASTVGVYGILIGTFILLAHMCSLRSFGAPYLAPVAPIIWNELKDSLIRAPHWLMKSRPRSITWSDSTRQRISLKPVPSKPNKEGDDH
ncbi:spore germination protein [Paenibacillus sanfengchensis]|uniref:spore germination protein n=1 Tax=Paenibacillus sanfengchensis TaxID=3119819 RepID=UPI002FE354CF